MLDQLEYMYNIIYYIYNISYHDEVLTVIFIDQLMAYQQFELHLGLLGCKSIESLMGCTSTCIFEDSVIVHHVYNEF